MRQIIYFSIQADDPERAARFYAAVFGWQITKWDGQWKGASDYWLLKTGSEEEPGIEGYVMKRRAPILSNYLNGFMCSIASQSIDDDIASVKAHGGTIVLPKVTIPHLGWAIHCKDTEGNFFEIRQLDPDAI